MNKVTRLDYCQFLLVSQTNYSLTNFAEHAAGFSHAAVKGNLGNEKLTARMVWENGRSQVVHSENGSLAFDDTGLDHNRSFKIELVRRQYSGNGHGVIKGIGVVTCVSINPQTDQFWIIDYRIYDPVHDGKTKLEQVREMLDNARTAKGLPCRGGWMDRWYTERKRMLPIERLGQFYYGVLKANRQVDDSDGERGYARIASLTWTDEEIQHGKRLPITDVPAGHRLKVFRLVLSPKRTDYILTNDFAQASTQATREGVACAGSLSSFTAKPSKLPALKVVSVAWRVFNVTIVPVPFWSGFASHRLLKQVPPPFTTSSKLCSMIPGVLYYVHLPFQSSLP